MSTDTNPKLVWPGITAIRSNGTERHFGKEFHRYGVRRFRSAALDLRLGRRYDPVKSLAFTRHNRIADLYNLR
jgi:hypothetical protein